MPEPSDPGWSLATDDHGCQVWRNPNDQFRGGATNPDSRYCGVRPDDEEPVGGHGECPQTSAIDVTSEPYAPPRTSPGACSIAEVEALREFAEAKKYAGTLSEWSAQVSAECGACVFSAEGDRWAPIVVENDQTRRLNYGGCVELQTGNESCGRAYQQLGACRVAACIGCGGLQELIDCVKGTATSRGACKAAFDAAAAACGDGLPAAEEACSGRGWPFLEGAIRAQCVVGAGPDAGNGE